jgi:hypothetical protein
VKFTLEIDMENVAFEDDLCDEQYHELSRCLRTVADRVKDGIGSGGVYELNGNIYDINGNKVGKFEVK